MKKDRSDGLVERVKVNHILNRSDGLFIYINI